MAESSSRSSVEEFTVPVCLCVAFVSMVAVMKGCNADMMSEQTARQAIEAGYEQQVVEGQVVWRKAVEEKP